MVCRGIARGFSSPRSRLMRLQASRSSAEELITNTRAGEHMAMAFAILMRASPFWILSSFARLASSSDAANTRAASAAVFTPPTSDRISVPFLSSSIRPPCGIRSRMRMCGMHIYSIAS